MRKTIFDITPQTHVRVTQGDSILFRIPRHKLRPSGLKRLERIERYNQYKDDLNAVALQKRFIMPSQGLSIHFFIPMPKSWCKWQKEVMHLKLHQGKPDIDNLTKAFFDSLLKEDKNIGHLAEVSKQWVDAKSGWIELIEGDRKYDEWDFKVKPPKNSLPVIKVNNI